MLHTYESEYRGWATQQNKNWPWNGMKSEIEKGNTDKNWTEISEKSLKQVSDFCNNPAKTRRLQTNLRVLCGDFGKKSRNLNNQRRSV